MNNNDINNSLYHSTKESTTLIEKLFAIAQPNAVYSEPVSFEKHAHSIITASEVMVGMGFGYGMGSGTSSGTMNDNDISPDSANKASASSVNGISASSVNGSSTNTKEESHDNHDSDKESGGGGGGGGGGYSSARPVAIITIGPNGVHVKPIIDSTKIAIAFLTTIASMFMMWAKMRRG